MTHAFQSRPGNRSAAKLTAEQVAWVRMWLSPGSYPEGLQRRRRAGDRLRDHYTTREVAWAFGLSHAAVSKIKRGLTWKS